MFLLFMPSSYFVCKSYHLFLNTPRNIMQVFLESQRGGGGAESGGVAGGVAPKKKKKKTGTALSSSRPSFEESEGEDTPMLPASSSGSATFDIPIFTDEFMEHNKVGNNLRRGTEGPFYCVQFINRRSILLDSCLFQYFFFYIFAAILSDTYNSAPYFLYLFCEKLFHLHFSSI